jgi:vesicle transport through interaction with t-SNAREs protein 1
MDTSPTALFDSYEQDFKQLILSIEEKLQVGEGRDERGGRYSILHNLLPH